MKLKWIATLLIVTLAGCVEKHLDPPPGYSIISHNKMYRWISASGVSGEEWNEIQPALEAAWQQYNYTTHSNITNWVQVLPKVQILEDPVQKGQK